MLTMVPTLLLIFIEINSDSYHHQKNEIIGPHLHELPNHHPVLRLRHRPQLRGDNCAREQSSVDESDIMRSQSLICRTNWLRIRAHSRRALGKSSVSGERCIFWGTMKKVRYMFPCRQISDHCFAGFLSRRKANICKARYAVPKITIRPRIEHGQAAAAGRV
jgi:hypothetical protein